MLYRPLDASKREIRLLTIEPSAQPDAPLICSLSIASIPYQPIFMPTLGDSDPEEDPWPWSVPQPPSFQTISYAWGDKAPTERLMVGDDEIAITPNLACALRAVRQPDEAIAIWADAVCIAQHDVEERNQQVRLMQEIYMACSRVNVWLGPEFEGVSEAFTTLSRLADGRSLLSQLVHDSSATQRVQQLTRVFSCSWWSRLWVIQEVLLARRAVMLCGSYSIGFSTIMQAFEALWNEYVAAGQLLRGVCGAETMEALVRQLEMTVRRLHIVYSCVFDENRHGRRIDCPPERLPFLLHTCSWSQVTDPRDAIYGVLGLFSNTLALVPNYSLPVSQVFTNSTFAILKCMGNGAILSQVQRAVRGSDLPSWVPDFTKPTVLSAPYLIFYELYRAGQKEDNTKTMRGELVHGKILLLRAVSVEEVSEIGDIYDHLGSRRSVELPALLSPVLNDWIRRFALSQAPEEHDEVQHGEDIRLPTQRCARCPHKHPADLAKEYDLVLPPIDQGHLDGSVIDIHRSCAREQSDRTNDTMDLSKPGEQPRHRCLETEQVFPCPTSMGEVGTVYKLERGPSADRAALMQDYLPQSPPQMDRNVASAHRALRYGCADHDFAETPLSSLLFPTSPGNFASLQDTQAPLYYDGDYESYGLTRTEESTFSTQYHMQSTLVPILHDVDNQASVDTSVLKHTVEYPDTVALKRYDSSTHSYVSSADHPRAKGSFYPQSQADLLTWMAKWRFSWTWQMAVKLLSIPGAEFLRQAAAAPKGLIRRIMYNITQLSRNLADLDEREVYRLLSLLRTTLDPSSEYMSFRAPDVDSLPVRPKSDTETLGRSLSQDDFWRTLCMDAIDCHTFQTYRRCSPPDYQRVQEWLAWILTGERQSDGIPQLHWHLNTILQGKRMIKTSAGRLGLVTSEVKLGDKICILAGEAYPYVLRPVDEEPNGDCPRYQLVCPAYIHGLMDGEVVNKSATFGPIHIV